MLFSSSQLALLMIGIVTMIVGIANILAGTITTMETKTTTDIISLRTNTTTTTLKALRGTPTGAATTTKTTLLFNLADEFQVTIIIITKENIKIMDIIIEQIWTIGI